HRVKLRESNRDFVGVAAYGPRRSRHRTGAHLFVPDDRGAPCSFALFAYGRDPLWCRRHLRSHRPTTRDPSNRSQSHLSGGLKKRDRRVPLWVTPHHSAMSAGCPVCPKADTAGRFMSTRPSVMAPVMSIPPE